MHLLNSDDPALNEVAKSASQRHTATAAVELFTVDGSACIVGCDDTANRWFRTLQITLTQHLVINALRQSFYGYAGAGRFVGGKIFFVNGVEIGEKPLDTYEAICTARGFILRGNEYDYERCAKAVFDDFRKGRIGKICLETEEISADSL